MDIVNETTRCDDPDIWTFKKSWGRLRIFNYNLHSISIQHSAISANNDLHLGSDHRNLSASDEYIRSMELWKFRKQSFKGWKANLSDAHDAFEYHLHRETVKHDCPQRICRI